MKTHTIFWLTVVVASLSFAVGCSPHKVPPRKEPPHPVVTQVFIDAPEEYKDDFDELKALLPFWPKLPAPAENDWLANFPESPQTKANLLAKATKRARDRKLGAAIQPILPLDAATRQMLPIAARGLEIVYQCPARVRPPIATPAAYFRGGKQLNASRVLAMLGKLHPKDAWGFAGVTSFDMGVEDLNFVFGLGAGATGDNVTSTNRLGSRDPAKAFRRMFATLVHELGHGLGLSHCIAYSCVMNGCNHLKESDSRPTLFCPHCAAKLHALRGIDPARVYCGLVQFYDEQGLTADSELARKACEALKADER